MQEDIKKMQNEEIQQLHKEATRFAALIDNGIRIGVKTAAFDALQKRVQDRLKELEAEFYTRKPEEEINRARQFLTLCDQMITSYNVGMNAATTNLTKAECFVEFNKPSQGEKFITWNGFDENGEKQKQEVIAPMQGNDYLFAALELALDEWAKTLPDNLEPQTQE